MDSINRSHNWRDPFGVRTTNREVRIKVLLPKGYRFNSEKSDELQRYLPCMAIVNNIIGDCLYEYLLVTEDYNIRTCGYAAGAIPCEYVSLFKPVEQPRQSQVFKCDHCPHETDTCVKIVHDDYVECVESDPFAKHKTKIYISGPISGHDLETRRKAFKEVQQMLECKGYEAVNPMENGLPDEATTHEHMKRDIKLLMTCDSIYMMRRWTHRKGCKVEFDVATAIGLPVIFEESGELIGFE